ncbi:hypothetical protein ACQ4PT_000825 [Festuca glaucescens]
MAAMKAKAVATFIPPLSFAGRNLACFSISSLYLRPIILPPRFAPLVARSTRFSAVPTKRHILGIGTLDGFDQVKMAYKRRRKDAEISGDTEYLLKLERAYDAVMMEQLQNRKKGVVNGSIQVSKDIRYADNQPIVPWGPRYSHFTLQPTFLISTAKDIRINMAISATSILCMSTMGHADWKPLQFLCFAYFCRMLEKLKSTEPAITPAYNEYGEVEGRGIILSFKLCCVSLGLVLGLIFAASLGYTGLTNFSQFLGHYIPSVVYNFQVWYAHSQISVGCFNDGVPVLLCYLSRVDCDY